MIAIRRMPGRIAAEPLYPAARNGVGRGSMGENGSGARPGRIALFDNLRGVLVVLVVIGHVIHPVHNDNPALSAVFDLIYLFHMPLFVFLSGLFAKGAWRGGRLNVNRIISFFVLGFGFQVALMLINGAARTLYRLLSFTSAPWYLLAMGWWYLLTPLLSRLGARRGMALSVALALAGGCVDLSDGMLAISRTLAFLPCFALGYYLTPRSVERLRKSPALWAAVAAAAALAVVRALDARAFDWFFPMVYGDNPYPGLAELGAAALPGGVAAKITALSAAAVCSLAALKLVPSGASALGTLGTRSLQIYVLHRLICSALRFHTDIYGTRLALDPLGGTLLSAALTVAIIAVCALPVFERPFTRLLRIRWLPDRTEERNAGGAS